MTTILGELTRHRDWWLRNFEGQTIVQDGISRRHKAIEFRRAGEITFDLFEGRFRQEKAVDVKLASDLIVLRDIYDVAIILSGDQDFVPAVEIVKDFGKRVVNIAFLTRGGRLLPGGARRLNQITDWSIELSHQELGPYLGL